MSMNEIKTQQYWLQTTDSTMREAREVSQDNDFVLVSTVEQTTGRGTKGRSWLCGKGNIFMTVAIRSDVLGDSNLPMLPLNTGILLHKVYSQYLYPDFQAKMWIKWPNDILVETRKVSGVLMESNTNYLYVGIGINTAVAPFVTDGGRQSGCLSDYAHPLPSNKKIVLEIYEGLVGLILNPTTAEEVVKSATQRMEWEQPVFLRSNPEKPWNPICLTKYGELKVRDDRGEEHLLSAEYLE